MQDKRPTVADLLAMKGKRQLSMLRVETLEEAEAAQKAGIDMLSVPPDLLDAGVPGGRADLLRVRRARIRRVCVG